MITCVLCMAQLALLVCMGAARTIAQVDPGPKGARLKVPSGDDRYAPRNNSRDGLTYVWVPPGTFFMGCDVPSCLTDQKPTHEVEISTGFWISQYEVTLAALRQGGNAIKIIKDLAARRNLIGFDPVYERARNRPVTPEARAEMSRDTLKWDEAQAYCTAVGGRLPTEAEWEYASRGGSTMFVNSPLSIPIRPNGYGLYLSGELEWASDWHGSEYYAKSPLRDPRGPDKGAYRVARRADHYIGIGYGRVDVSKRIALQDTENYFVTRRPADSLHLVGFRCVATDVR